MLTVLSVSPVSLTTGATSTEIHARASDGFTTYMGGINQALSPDREFIVGYNLTLADICFVAELSLFCNERTRARELEKQGHQPILHGGLYAEFPRAMAHFSRLRTHAAFAPDMEPYLKKIEASAQAEAERSLAQ